MKYLILLSLLYAPLSFAQSAAQLQAQLENKAVRLWGITLVNTTSTTILEPDDYRSDTNSTFTGVYRYRLPWFNFRALLSGNKTLTGSRQDRFTTAFLEASKPVSLLSGERVTTIFQGRLTPPVNDERRYEEKHLGGVSGGLLFIVTPPNPRFQIVAVSRVTKNFHEFTVNRSFGQNTSVTFMNYAAASYFPHPKWELGVNVTNMQGWDYRGDSGENNIFLGQSIGYNYSNNVIMTFGHELGGRTYGYDQNNVDIALYDSSKSSVYASMSYNY